MTDDDGNYLGKVLIDNLDIQLPDYHIIMTIETAETDPKAFAQHPLPSLFHLDSPQILNIKPYSDGVQASGDGPAWIQPFSTD